MSVCDCEECRRARGAWTRFIVWVVVLVVLIVSGGAVACDEPTSSPIPDGAWPWLALFALIGLVAVAGLVQVLNFIARRAGHGP